jgi:hypothetical protein
MEIPLDQIRRPLMRTRANDPVKVQELMDSIRIIGLQVPVGIYICIFSFYISSSTRPQDGLVLIFLDGFSTRFKHSS